MKSRSRKKPQSPIFDNALDAVRCGIEDYKIGTEARLKSAVRNVHAGVLLLFKEKLSMLSPPGSDNALIKRHVVPFGQGRRISWKGSGKATVDTYAMSQRLKSLNVKFDEKKLEAINKIRNDVEHYYTTVNQQTINEAITKSFALICTFMRDELRLDPKKRIGNELWTTFIQIRDVYETEREVCVASHRHFNSYSETLNSHVAEATCESCDSDLIKFRADGKSACRACGAGLDRDQSILRVVDCAFGVRNYIAAKESCEPHTRDCPVCSEEAFIVSDLICALCGESSEGECPTCGNSYSVDEIGESQCFYCRYKMEKDD